MQELLTNIFKVYRDTSSGGWGYSYFVKRPTGNILFARMANTASIASEYDAISERGGLYRIYITYQHFAGKNVDKVADTFGADIYCSQIEAPEFSTMRKKSMRNTVLL